MYDIESLWVLGSEFDEQSQELVNSEENSIFYQNSLIADLKPASDDDAKASQKSQ